MSARGYDHVISGGTLALVEEHKLADLVGAPPGGGVLEASGVVTANGAHFVVFDNIRRVARIAVGLRAAESEHRWVGTARAGEGYEDIAYSPHRKCFYLLVEAEKHPDGTYKGAVDECDASWQHSGRRWIDFVFPKRNRGFEGLAVLRWEDVDYLLALCESRKGNIQVLRLDGPSWRPVAEVVLPPLGFKDHSAIALRGCRLALVSQKSSRLWVGALQPGGWTIDGDGQVYDLPRTEKGKRLYCTVEGVDWLSESTLVMVSDLSKPGYPGRCARTDQSIHVFRLPDAP